jgi:FkbM family methyltransferase
MRRHHFRKLLYYWHSVVTLAGAMEPQSLLRMLLWTSGRQDLTLKSGLRFRVGDLLDLLILKETLFDDAYRLRRLPDEPRLIVDVGAGFGDFTVLAASMFPRASVVACEPNPQAFALLERNVRENRLANVDARCVAVGTAADYELVRPRWSVETSRQLTKGSRFTAVGVRLDELIGRRDAQLVKIDCEGAELDVLESLGDAIGQVDCIAAEYHSHLAPSAGDRVEQFLRARRFLVTREPDRYDARIGYIYGTATRDDRDPQDVEGHLK